MEDLLELDDNGIEVDDLGTSQGEPQSTVSAPPSKRQPAKVNLDEFEDFRKFKSESQKRESQYQRERDLERQQRLELENRLRRLETQGMDESTLAAYERDELRRILAQRDQDEAARYQNFVWSQLMDEVSREHGIPVEELEDAKDSNELWRRGRKWEKENRNKRRSQDDDDDEEVIRRPVDDRVDFGGGKPASSGGKYQKMYNNAVENGDMLGMFAAEELAYKAGVKLKHQQ